MTAFAEQVRQFGLRVHARTQDAFVAIAQATKDSIVQGSPVTGAPGQPVDTGALKASWILAFPNPMEATITTGLVYAPFIEDGIAPLQGKGNVTGTTQRRLTLRSAVGGFHSVKQTVANFDRLVAVTMADGAPDV